MDNTRLDLIKLIGEVTNMESQSVKPDRRAIHDKLVSQLQDFSAPGRIPSVFDIKSCYDLIIDALIACEQNKFFSSKKKLGKLKSFTRYNLYDLGLLVDLYTTRFQSSAIPKGLFTVAIDKLLTPPEMLITALEYTSLTGVPKAETWPTSRLLMQRHNMQQIAAAYSNEMLDHDWVTKRYNVMVKHKAQNALALDMLDSLFDDSESYKNALAKALAIQLSVRFNLNTESGLTFESIADKLLDMDFIVRAIANRDLIKSNHFSAQRRVMNQMDQENLQTFAGALSTKDTSEEVTEYDLLKGIVASIDQAPRELMHVGIMPTRAKCLTVLKLFKDGSESYQHALSKAYAAQLNERFNLNAESGLTFESIAHTLLEDDCIYNLVMDFEYSGDDFNYEKYEGALSLKDSSKKMSDDDYYYWIEESFVQIADNFLELAPEVSDESLGSLDAERSSGSMEAGRTSSHSNRLSELLTKGVDFNSDGESTSDVTSDDTKTTRDDTSPDQSDNESQKNADDSDTANPMHPLK